MTRRETFESLDDIWMREVDMYSTVEDSVKMVVANKLDKVTPFEYWLVNPGSRYDIAYLLLTKAPC